MRRTCVFALIVSACALFLVSDREAGWAQSYEYDVDGRLVSVTREDGMSIRYRYDPSGNLLSRTVTSQVSFHRGDPNRDGRVDVSDGVFVVLFLFGDQISLDCRESADANNDGAIDITDGTHLLNYIFLGDAPPAAPGPPGTPCGTDPDDPGGAGDLGWTVRNPAQKPYIGSSTTPRTSVVSTVVAARPVRTLRPLRTKSPTSPRATLLVAERRVSWSERPRLDGSVHRLSVSSFRGERSRLL